MIPRVARTSLLGIAPLLFLGCLLLAAGGAQARLFQDTDLLVVDSENANGSGILYDLNPVTGKRSVISSGGLLHQPIGVCFDASGNIVVADAGYRDSGSLVRIDPNTGAQSHVATSVPLNQPLGVVLESSGDLIVTEEGSGGALLRVDPVTGQTDVIHAGSPFTVSTTTAIDGNGDFIVSSINPATITRVNHISGAATLIARPPVDGPIGIIIDRANPGRALLAIRAFDGPSVSGLSCVDLSSGVVTPLSVGNHFILPSELAQDASGHIYMGNEDSLTSPTGQIYQVDPTTGSQTLIASGFLTPRGILAVPEPATPAVLLITGCMAGSRRRRRQATVAMKKG